MDLQGLEGYTSKIGIILYWIRYIDSTSTSSQAQNESKLSTIVKHDIDKLLATWFIQLVE
jgi:hypothetical protein